MKLLIPSSLGREIRSLLTQDALDVLFRTAVELQEDHAVLVQTRDLSNMPSQHQADVSLWIDSAVPKGMQDVALPCLPTVWSTQLDSPMVVRPLSPAPKESCGYHGSSLSDEPKEAQNAIVTPSASKADEMPARPNEGPTQRPSTTVLVAPKIEVLTKENKELTQLVSMWKSQASNLEGELFRARLAITSLVQQILVLSKEQMENRVAFDSKVQHLEQALNSALSDTVTLKNQLHYAKRRRDNEVDTLKRQSQSHREELESVHKALNEANMEAMEQEKQIETLYKEIENFDKKIETLKKETKELKARLRKFAEDFESTHSLVHALEEEKKNALAQFEKVTNELRDKDLKLQKVKLLGSKSASVPVQSAADRAMGQSASWADIVKTGTK
jgi:predicted RNase H-like nuclease (RuvC/YqgF family)